MEETGSPLGQCWAHQQPCFCAIAAGMAAQEAARTLGTRTDHQMGGLVPGAHRGQQRGRRRAQHQGSCRFGLVSSPGKVTSTRNALQTHGNAPPPALFFTSTHVTVPTQETFPRRQRQVWREGAEGGHAGYTGVGWAHRGVWGS